MLKIMLTEMPLKDPIDELWLYHIASRTVIGGENLGWILLKEAHASMPFMMRMMMKPERLYIMNGPRRVADRERVAAYWKTILAWPAQTAMTYDSVGLTSSTHGSSWREKTRPMDGIRPPGGKAPVKASVASRQLFNSLSITAASSASCRLGVPSYARSPGAYMNVIGVVRKVGRAA